MNRNEQQTLWLSVLMGLLLMGAVRANAGTYNFYFNNTEQGDNSTAEPSLVVKDGKEMKEDGATSSQAAPTPVSTPAANVISEPIPVEEHVDRNVEPRYEQDFKSFRFTGGPSFNHVQYLEEEGFNSYFGSSVFRNTRTKTTKKDEPSFSLEGSYFFTPYLAGTAFLGKVSGLEVEVSPFRTDSAVSLAVLVGASEYSAENIGEKYVLHGGARLSFNFSDAFGFHVTGRYGVPDEGFRLYQASAGIIFRI